MKTLDLKSLLVGVLLTMVVVVVMLIATASSTSTIWEYKVVFVEQGRLGQWEYENRINAVAKDGWEAVGVTEDTDYRLKIVMRRPKQPQPPSWWARWRFWKK